MFTYTIAQLKSDWEAALHGTSLDDVPNPNDLISRAARQVLNDIDLMETKRVAQLTNPIFDKVYNVLVPSDLKLNKVIDIRPQVNRNGSDNFVQHGSKEFDLFKAVSSIAIDTDTGLKFMRISADLLPGILLNDFGAVTGGNGAWAGTGVATNLATDQIYHIDTGASMSFDKIGRAHV